jgi:pantothenate kinase type III
MGAAGYNFTIQTAVQFTTVDCYKCGVVFAVDRTLEAMWRRDRTQFFCPNGHGQSYTKSEADRLREQLETAKRETEQQRAEAERQRQFRVEAERRVIAQRGVVTKLKKRVNCGVCPHCQRTVAQMARHIKSKHPEVLEPSKAVVAVDPHAGDTTE